jgi:hypothetical protein
VVWLAGRGQGPTQQLPEPARNRPSFCQGCYGPLPPARGRFMSETHAPFWIYGSGRVRLFFAPSPLQRMFTVDGQPEHGPVLRLGRADWHVITVDVPHLVAHRKKRVGLLLRGLLVD